MDGLQRYVDRAARALRKAAPPRGGRATRRNVQEHRQLWRQTLAARLDALRQIAADRDVLEECADLGWDLVEVASAIAYARLTVQGRQTAHEQERQRMLGRIRVRRLRARARGDRAALGRLARLRALWTAPPRAALLWAHAGLYQYVVTHHNYDSAGWRRRERLDALMQDLLELSGLARAGDYQALRRHRRLLRGRRPGLFPGLPASQP